LYDDERGVKTFHIDDYLQCGAGIIAALAQYLGVALDQHIEQQQYNPEKMRQKLLKSLKASLQFTEHVITAYRTGREHNSDS
jgi:hypothetical protein